MMEPAHVGLVVDMAWHTCAAVFQPEHPLSQVLQVI
jgi:hypothetical protein